MPLLKKLVDYSESSSDEFEVDAVSIKHVAFEIISMVLCFNKI